MKTLKLTSKKSRKTVKKSLRPSRHSLDKLYIAAAEYIKDIGGSAVVVGGTGIMDEGIENQYR